MEPRLFSAAVPIGKGGGGLIGYTIAAAVILIILVYTGIARRGRLRSQGKPPAGFEPTDEVFIDPTTGLRQRVWYNAKTGDRHYETLDTSS